MISNFKRIVRIVEVIGATLGVAMAGIGSGYFLIELNKAAQGNALAETLSAFLMVGVMAASTKGLLIYVLREYQESPRA